MWVNTATASQSGRFAAVFHATPNQNNADVLMTLTGGAAATYTDLPVIVRFNSNGTIDVRDGATYRALTTVGYSAGKTYKFRVKVNPATQTYDVYVTKPNGVRKQLASGFHFRSDAGTVSAFTNFAKVREVGNVVVSGLSVASLLA